jgi:hypothetical protein
MFVVRDAQIEAMLEPSRHQFVERTQEWLRGKYARKLETTRDDALRALVRSGMERALKYGIDTERSISLFVELWVVRGPGFDESEEAAWLAGLLEDPDVPGQQKAEYLHRNLLPPDEG